MNQEGDPVTKKQNPGENQKTGRFWVAVAIVAVVVIVVVGAIIWKSVRSGITEETRDLGDGRTLNFNYDRAEIVPDFPQDLILDDGPKVRNSFTIEDIANGVTQSTTQYKASGTLEENIAVFSADLEENGWFITNDANPTVSPTFIYAIRDNEEVNVTFDDSGLKVSVTVAYSVSE